LNKKCTKCGQTKHTSEFYKHKQGKHGVASYCKECDRKRIKSYYNKNAEGYKKYFKKYYRENKESLREKRREKVIKELMKRLEA